VEVELIARAGGRSPSVAGRTYGNPDMQYVNLGRTGLKVSRLSLGAMGFGSPEWRSWVLAEEQSRAVARKAFDAGINVIDTCDYYSSGRSEEIVGRLCKDFVKRSEIVIATKVGNPMGKGPNARGFSRKHLFEGVEASLRRLGTDYIDLYQTHIWDAVTNIEEMVRAFDDLVRSGRVLYLGITDMPAWQFARAFYYAKYHGLARFVSVQNHYNPIWREDERELMPFCRTEGVGLIPYSPLGRGFLCGKQRRTDPAATERAKSDDYALKIYGRDNDHAVAAVIEQIAEVRGVQPGQIALAWTLARPGVTSPIFGPTRVEHVDAAIAALEIALTKDEIAKIDGSYQPRPAAGHGI
jgi:1-deoxyxylulose-5-phosphate synthase